MSDKKETNKVIVLVIVGLVLAWLVGGFMGGFMGNIFFAVAMAAVIFSGVFGAKALGSVGGISVPFSIGIIIATGSWGRWWQYIICYLVAIFIGNALSNFRPNSKQELFELDNELKYDLFVKDDNFAIKFPKKPKPIKFGSTRMYRYDYKNSASFNMSVNDTDTPKTKKEVWEKLASELRARHNFAEVDYEKREMLGHPCVSATSEDQNGNIFYEVIFLNDKKVYVIVLAVTEADETLFNKFVDSFRFIKS